MRGGSGEAIQLFGGFQTAAGPPALARGIVTRSGEDPAGFRSEVEAFLNFTFVTKHFAIRIQQQREDRDLKYLPEVIAFRFAEKRGFRMSQRKYRALHAHSAGRRPGQFGKGAREGHAGSAGVGGASRLQIGIKRVPEPLSKPEEHSGR